MARKNNQKRLVRVLTRKVQQERRANRKLRAQTPVSAEQIVANIRAAICTHVGTINRRIDHNANRSQAAIIAAFGSDASTLGSYLALGQTLGVHPAGSSGQCYTSGQ